MSATKVFSVRVGEALHRKLDEDATAAGRSLSEHARELLSSSVNRAPLSPTTPPESSEAVAQIKLLRAEVSNSIEAILVATRALTPSEARELIAKQFS